MFAEVAILSFAEWRLYMTIVDKKKCAETFEMLTGEKTNPEEWNQTAANLLAEMVAKITECSDAMDFVPRPSGFKPGWSYIVKNVYGNLKRQFFSGDTRKYYEICLTAAGPLKRQVKIALATGE